MLAVVVFHLNPAWLPGGFAGVDVFFVLSGYLITGIIVREQAAGTFRFARFYQRRIARIFPAFAVVACATLLAAGYIYTTQDFASAGADFSAALLSISNFHLLNQGNYFALSPDAQPFLHYWSLAVEEQFYLLYPLGLWFLLQRAPHRWFPYLLGLGLLGFACSVFLTFTNPAWAFYLLPSRAWELIAGGLLVPILSKAREIPCSQGLAWAGMAALAGSFIFLHGAIPFPGVAALAPVLGTLCLLTAASASPAARHHPPVRFLRSPFLIPLGKVSYSLYLWHWPLFSIIDYSLPLVPSGQRLILKMLCTSAATLVSYHWIERPCRAALCRTSWPLPGSTRSLRWPAFMIAFALTAALVPVGFGIRKTHYLDAAGAPDRRLAFDSPGAHQTIVLMGDSQASMYGVALRDLARSLNLRLILISAAGEDPLAPSGSPAPELWQENLRLIQQEKPALVILTCHWVYKLTAHPQRLADTLAALRPHTNQILLLTQPPLLPEMALRPALRAGSRAPWMENASDRGARLPMNQIVRQAISKDVTILDVEPLFINPDGSIALFDADQRPLFQDKVHLSNFGVARVGPLLQQALEKVIAAPHGKP